MELYFNDGEKVWMEHKEPFAVIECETEQDFKDLKHTIEHKTSVQEIIEEVRDTVCNDLCKYVQTTDNDFVCDCVREYGSCPLDRL